MKRTKGLTMTNLSSPVTLAPDFELTDTQGRTIRLSDYRGKPVVLVLLRGFM
jgi:peroxiredoxin